MMLGSERRAVQPRSVGISLRVGPRLRSFLVFSGLPSLVAATYYAGIATPVYVSTGSLVVYKAGDSTPGLTAMLSGSAGGGSLEGGYVLRDYVKSWTEFEKVNAKFDLKQAWGQGDFVSRYGGLTHLFQRNDVALWHYYQGHVVVKVDINSGIVSLRVLGTSQAFSAELGQQILQDTIAHIDAMNQQEEADHMQRADEERTQVESLLHSDEARLGAYRSNIGIYDPEALYNSQLGFLQNMKEEAARLEAQHGTITSATPNSPIGRDMEVSIDSLQAKINAAQANFTKLSSEAAGYDPLVIAEKNDTALLAQADAAVQEAELNADQNKYYLDVISPMSRPVTSELPNGPLDTLLTFVATFILWIFVR